MKRFLILLAVLIGLGVYSEAAEARGLAPRARVLARVDNRVARRAVRRGLAFRRPAVVFRNAVAFRHVNRAALFGVDRVGFAFAPHFNRANFVQLVPTTVGYSRVQLIAAADPCDVPTADDNPPLAASFRRRLLVAEY